MTDCLIIGFNDSNFDQYVDMVRSMGEHSGAYRDLNLAFITHNNRHYRALDALSHFQPDHAARYYHNTDFLWPTITYLGSYLAKRGLTFDYVNLFQSEKEKLKEKLLKGNIRTIAITTTLYISAHPILEIMDFIRQYNTTAKIIVGGPFISNKVQTINVGGIQDVFQYINADIFVFSREGEFALYEILKALKSGTSLDSVDNIAYRNGNDYITTRYSVESNSLEENLIDYSLFPTAELGQFISTRTAKSCPFSCAFCSFPTRAGKYTYLDIGLVERELNALQDIGSLTTLTILDDTFNVPKKRFREILRMMIRNKYDFKWNSFYRSDHGDPETIELMKEAGCEGVFLGMESGSDTILKKMRKTARRKHYMEAIPLFREAGIITYCSLIIGFPGETRETIQETIDLIETTRPDFYRGQLWYADPVTPVWQKREEYNLQGSAFNWSHYTMDSQTAADWVDQLFLTVENSIWLPQWGFELWSVFYLERMGMSRKQIKTFIQCFNGVIKEKLIHSDTHATAPDLIESLSQSCQFDAAITPDMRAVQRLSAADYNAAERFWMDEFRPEPLSSNLTNLYDSVSESAEGWSSYICDIDETVLTTLRRNHDRALPHALLSAYSVLLSQIGGKADTAVVSVIEQADGESLVVPIRLQPEGDLRFSQFVQTVRQKHAEALHHQQFVAYILTNPSRLSANEMPAPVLDAGYIYTETNDGQDGRPLSNFTDGVQLVLRVTSRFDSLNMEIEYNRAKFSISAIEQLTFHFSALLQILSEDADICLTDTRQVETGITNNLVTEMDASEAFNF